MKTRRPRVRIWPAPIALAAVTAVGLIAALLSDRAGDVLAWITLAAPVAIVLWFWAPRREAARIMRADRERSRPS